MTLRARLLLALGGLLAAALVISGALVIGLTRQALVDQLDNDLVRATPDELLGLPGPGPIEDPAADRRFAVLIFRSDGSLAGAFPAGPQNAPDPLPSMPDGGVASLPLRQIVENAGEDAAVVLNAVKAGKGAYGYNAGSGEYGDMIEQGILDPAKVTRLALQNAASVAGLLLTTEVMIAEAPKEDDHAHGPGPGGMGGMGGMDM